MPVLVTKLHAPTQRERLVPRPRLLETFDGLLEPGQRLGLVSAPAGFGKTTLVGSWTSSVANDVVHCVSVAWVSLDEADNDLGRLMAHVLTALQRAGAPVDVGLLDASGSEPMGVTAARALLTAVVNTIAGAGELGGPAAAADAAGTGIVSGTPAGRSRRWLLVLDDYHVIAASEVHEAIGYLVDNLPEQLRLLVSTRSDPPMPLARLRSRGQLTELRAEQMRFTHAEAGTFLNQVMGLNLEKGDVAALDDRTEGWAAGLQLAGLSLRGRTRARDVSDFIAAFTGSNRFVVDYLTDEVLAQQSEEVRRFLLRTSILDHLTGSLCDALTGACGGHEVLDRLERENLFVVPLDEDRTWYRYHHLFADVLRSRLRASEADLVDILHRAASDWYAAHGSVEDGVRHALAGRDIARAGRLMETGLSRLRRQRRDALMLSWLRALPAEVVEPNPVLSTAVGWAAMVAGDLQAVQRHLDDADRALAAAVEDPAVAAAWVDTDDLRAAPASVHMYRAALAQARGDTDGTATHARAALSLAGPEDHFIRGAGAGLLGLASWASGDIKQALPTFEQSVTSLRAAGNVVDTLDSTIVLAGMWVTAGRRSRARALCEQALRTATADGEPYPRATADLHTWLAELAVMRNDLADADHHLATSSTLAERAFITENQHRWPTVAAGVCAVRGEYPRALDLLDEATRRYRAGFYPDLQPLAATRARVHLAAGDLDAALRWVQHAGITFQDPAEFVREYEHLTLVRIHLALNLARAGDTAASRVAPGSSGSQPDVSGAMGLLGRLEEAAVTAGRLESVLEVRLLQALAQHASGDTAAAMETLAGAVQSAPEVDACGGLFLDEQAAVDALLHASSGPSDASGVASVRAWWQGLVAGEPATATAPETLSARTLAGRPPDPLSEREAEVLRLLASELTGPEIARSLYVTLNTLRTHTQRIFAKLDVTGRGAAVRRARDLGLL
ncbi:MAG TPA: LuxR C-terminal-related transcriptional regulator [Nocardioidaceae bacterium]|nr:LuxR C-terminal-related transcriptional regulator [Nocardioidaceae bacterium]